MKKIHNIKYKTANTFFTRLKGLIFVKEKTPLYIPKCNIIHTFWMTKSLHVVWINKDNEILKTEKNILPKSIRKNKKAYGVIEFFSDYISDAEFDKFCNGDKIK